MTDGDYIYINTRGDYYGSLKKFSWDGELQWSVPSPAPQGEIYHEWPWQLTGWAFNYIFPGLDVSNPIFGEGGVFWGGIDFIQKVDIEDGSVIWTVNLEGAGRAVTQVRAAISGNVYALNGYNNGFSLPIGTADLRKFTSDGVEVVEEYDLEGSWPLETGRPPQHPWKEGWTDLAITGGEHIHTNNQFFTHSIFFKDAKLLCAAGVQFPYSPSYGSTFRSVVATGVVIGANNRFITFQNDASCHT